LEQRGGSGDWLDVWREGVGFLDRHAPIVGRAQLGGYKNILKIRQ